MQDGGASTCRPCKAGLGDIDEEKENRKKELGPRDKSIQLS